ncbi:HepT-like ribonuclease domain-containing protein, partial [Candidatus Magnetobacterium casense]
ERFVSEMNYEDFSMDEKTELAVIRCIEVIGEAAKNIPEHVRDKYPQIPWKDMAGMRDIIAHAYFGIDMRRIWEVVTVKLPPLKKHIRQLLDDIAYGEFDGCR